jgi:glycine cleavage system H protein
MPQIGKYWLELDLYYTPDHTWMKTESSGAVKVGFDDFGQKLAGQIKFLRINPVGKELKQLERFGTLETGKWTGKLVAPVTGKIATVNQEVIKNPALINEDPYGKGWIITLLPVNLGEELKNLLHKDTAIEWLKKDIMEKAKEKI